MKHTKAPLHKEALWGVKSTARYSTKNPVIPTKRSAWRDLRTDGRYTAIMCQDPSTRFVQDDGVICGRFCVPLKENPVGATIGRPQACNARPYTRTMVWRKLWGIATPACGLARNDGDCLWLQLCVGFLQKPLGIDQGTFVGGFADLAGLVISHDMKCKNFPIHSGDFCLCPNLQAHRGGAGVL